MRVKYSPSLLANLKKQDVRIRKSFKERILIFSKNPHDLQLNNHPLHEPYLDRRSIDITADFRAHYKEIEEGNEKAAYFVSLGTHEELYKSQES